MEVQPSAELDWRTAHDETGAALKGLALRAAKAVSARLLKGMELDKASPTILDFRKKASEQGLDNDVGTPPPTPSAAKP